MSADDDVNNDLVTHYCAVYEPVEDVALPAVPVDYLGNYPELRAFCQEHAIILELTEECLALVETAIERSGWISPVTMPRDLGVFLGDTICELVPSWHWMVNPDGSAYLALGERTTWDVVDFIQRRYGPKTVLVSAFREMQRRALEDIDAY